MDLLAYLLHEYTMFYYKNKHISGSCMILLDSCVVQIIDQRFPWGDIEIIRVL